jgi:hypothetical protein
MRSVDYMSHPAIQPTDWSVPPESLRGEWPSKRVDLYRIIWDTTLARSLEPPRLEHTRLAATVDGQCIAAAFVEPNADAIGFWIVRTDWPRLLWVHNGPSPAPTTEPLRVNDAFALPVGVTLGRVIEQAARHGAGTPATIAQHLQAVIEERAFVRADPGEPVELTAAGRAALASSRDAGLPEALPLLSSLASAINDLRADRINCSAALEALGFSAPRAAQIGATIEAASREWEGTSQQAVLAQQELAAITPPRLSLPDVVDPERLLVPDDPLRALRVRMERELFARHIDWAIMAAPRQGDLRRTWLVENAPDVAAQLRLDGRYVAFDTLARWMLSQ